MLHTSIGKAMPRQRCHQNKSISNRPSKRFEAQHTAMHASTGNSHGYVTIFRCLLAVLLAAHVALVSSAREPSNPKPSTTPPAAAVAATAKATAKPKATAKATAAAAAPDLGTTGFAAAKAAFLREHGDQYGYKGWMDKHWQREVGDRFGPGMNHYLDFTGAALYTQSHIRAANKALERRTFSNPHSRNPSSLAAEREMLEARAEVLQFFNADPEEYTVVWTSGATGALKVVGENFPWTSPKNWHEPRAIPPGGYSDTDVGSAAPCADVPEEVHSATPGASQFVYLRSNHKSVLGIGAYAKARGAALVCVDEAGMERWLDSSSGSDSTDGGSSSSSSNHGTARVLSAVPAKAAAAGAEAAAHTPVAAAGAAAAASAGDADYELIAGVAEHMDAAATQLASLTGPKPSLTARPPATAAGVVASYSRSTGTASTGRASSSSIRSNSSSSISQVTYSIVAYPSKDNYEGRLYPLQWIDQIHAQSTATHQWLVVLDAAAYVPTHPLDLSQVHPDFVPVSWYKVFGFPSGLGALIARKEAVTLLHKTYFGGGSVVESTAEDIWRVLMPPPDGYEDGTQSFLSIAQLKFGFEQLRRLGGITAVERHVRSLQSWLYAALTNLKHGNGQPVVKLFGRHPDRDHHIQSCILQMLVLKPDGSVVSSAEVEKRAAAEGIGIREGCMCNPSQCNHDLGITPDEKRASILNLTDTSSGFLTVWRPDSSGQLQMVQLPVGSVRVSLGYLSTFEDVYAFVQFLRRNYLKHKGDTDTKHGDRQGSSTVASAAAGWAQV